MFNAINELLGCLSNTPKLIMVKLKSLISFNELIIKNYIKTNRLKPFHKKQYTYDLFSALMKIQPFGGISSVEGL